jgi:hypothetical protein
VATAALFYVNRVLLASARRYGYVAAVLLTIFLGVEVPSQYIGPAWLMLALLLFEIGVGLELKDFRYQAALAGVPSLFALAAVNIFSSTRPDWIPQAVAALCAYVFTARVVFLSSRRLPEPERTWFLNTASATGAAVLAALAWNVLPGQYVGPAWLLLALVLFEAGVALQLPVFRIESAVVGIPSLFWLGMVNVFSRTRPDWIPQAVAALTAYVFTVRIVPMPDGKLPPRERTLFLNTASAAGAAMVAALAWNLLPPPLVALAWAAESLVLMETGLSIGVPVLRSQGHIMGVVTFGRLFVANFTGTGATGPISHRLLTVLPVILLHYYLYGRLRDIDRRLARLYLYGAAILAAVLARFEFGRVLTVDAWAVYALALVICGIRWNNPDLRWQGYLLSLAAFVRSWMTNLYEPGTIAGMPGRAVTGAIVVASFYAGEFVTPRLRTEAGRAHGMELLDRYARTMFALLATALLALLLFYEVSGSLLTVAWGLEALGLMAVGFPGRERTLRISGLALFLVCVLKLFLYDLRNLDTPFRILSFMVMGALLLAVSWVYTQFREKIRRYL